MKSIKYFLSALCALALFSCEEKEPEKKPWEKPDDGGSTPGTEATDVKVGEVLPAWSEGCLDIHFINSANGECNFFILPDGTTLLVDAGEMPDKPGSVPRKPNASVRPYKVYSSYIKHFLPEGKTAIDWCAPSHFHIDHIGTPKCSEANHPEGGFAQSGLTALYNEVPYTRMLDLGYPDYEEDTSIPAIDGEMVTGNKDWQKFVKWAMENKGMTADRFRAGEEQITLVNNKAGYENFKVFNFIANTYAWYKKDGQAQLVHTGAGRNDLAGNPSSAGFHIKYGKFDYMGAGDMEKVPQNSLAYYYRDYVLVGGLDVFKANHHFNINSWGSQMQALLTPRVILAHTHYDNVPDIDIITNIMENKYPSAGSWPKKEIFVTNATNVSVMGKLAGYNGHIVVRVAPGGESYTVYMLDDNNMEYKVKSVHGPIDCQ